MELSTVDGKAGAPMSAKPARKVTGRYHAVVTGPLVTGCASCERLEADIYRLAEWETTWQVYPAMRDIYMEPTTFGLGVWLAAEEARIFGGAK
jgi:hypothetical protein